MRVARGILAAAAIGALTAACSVGQGSGSLTGSVHDVVCMVEEPTYSLDPTFFSADVIEDRNAPGGMPRRRLTMRIQRGSYREGDSDGLLVLVQDANEIQRSALGVPIPITGGDDEPVQLTLYLNETCESGFPIYFWTLPLVLEAQAGTITFDAIYAPDVDPDQLEIRARLEGVVFQDPEHPADRVATIDGSFQFLYQRGRPAQPFP